MWSRLFTRVDLRAARGVQVGHDNVQVNYFDGDAAPLSPLDLAADRLADRVENAWRTEATARGITTPAPATVRWRWGTPDVAAHPDEIDGAPVPLGSGAVNRLHDELYTRLPKLVLLGAPGAGKTGAMVLLLLTALERRRAPKVRRQTIPVPVWLTLGGWNPVTTSLTEWALTVLARDHSYLAAVQFGRDTPAELLRNGRIALFLDGLDEMSSRLQGRALERLDRESANLRIVLTSRRDEYVNALTTGRLHGAAVVEVQPVGPDAAADYLIRDQVGAQRERWQRVGAHLKAYPDTATAAALNNPLTLSLARATYRHADPAEMTDPKRFATAPELRAHLIRRVLLDAYPNDRERAHALRWLSWLAAHMDADRDLAWWLIPRWIPRLALTFATLVDVMLTATVVTAIGLWVLPILNDRPARMSAVSDGGVLLLGPAFGAVLWLGAKLIGRRISDQTVGPVTLRVRRLQLADVRRLIGVLVLTMTGVGLATNLAFILGSDGYDLARMDGLGSVADNLKGALAVTVAGTLGLGAPVGLIYGLYNLWVCPAERASAASPRSTYVESRRAADRVALAAGLLAGLTLGLATGAAFEPAVGLGFGVVVWVGVSVVVRLVVGSASIIGYAERILTGIPRRVRFIHLLEQARQRHVLRQAGAVYQFRHAEVQDHLAASSPRRRIRIRMPAWTTRPGIRRGLRSGAVTLLVVGLASAALPIVLDVVHFSHRTLTGAAANSLMLNSDGRLLAADGNRRITVWDTRSARIIRELPRPAVAFTRDGRFLLTHNRPRVNWWNLSTGRRTHYLNIGNSADVVELSPDDSTVATLYRTIGTVRLFNVVSGKATALPLPKSTDGWIEFSPDGKALATGGDGAVRLWNPATGTGTWTFPGESWGASVFSRDGKSAFTIAGGRTLQVWDMATGKRTTTVSLGEDASAADVRTDWKTVAFDGKPRRLRIEDVATGTHVDVVDVEQRVWRAEFSPTGTILATVSMTLPFSEQQLALWDVASGDRIETFAARGPKQTSPLAFSPDGATLATAWTDGRIRIWDLPRR